MRNRTLTSLIFLLGATLAMTGFAANDNPFNPVIHDQFVKLPIDKIRIQLVGQCPWPDFLKHCAAGQCDDSSKLIRKQLGIKPETYFPSDVAIVSFEQYFLEKNPSNSNGAYTSIYLNRTSDATPETYSLVKLTYPNGKLIDDKGVGLGQESIIEHYTDGHVGFTTGYEYLKGLNFKLLNEGNVIIGSRVISFTTHDKDKVEHFLTYVNGEVVEWGMGDVWCDSISGSRLKNENRLVCSCESKTEH